MLKEARESLAFRRQLYRRQNALMHEMRVRLDEVIRTVSEHPTYPEPCPMLHEVAAAAARTMDKEWIIHMVREACRQTKEAIIADLKQSLPNDKGDARRTCSPNQQDGQSPSNLPAC